MAEKLISNIMDEKDNEMETKKTEDEIKIEQVKNSSDPYIAKKKLIYCCFAFIGLVNNLGYVLIITSAQQFATKLDNGGLIAFYPLALIIFNSISRFINSKYCIKISYFKRVLGLSAYFCFGYVFLFIILTIIDNSDDFNKTLAFILTLIPSVIMGTGQSFGEATFLGYIRTFPEDYVSGWSSGTGFAGVFGASLSLIFKLIKESFDLKNLYLIVSPITIIFFFVFYLTYKIKNNIDKQNESNSEEGSKEENKDLPERPSDLIVENSNNRATDVSENKELSVENFPIVFKYGKRYIFNLMAVYFLEYTICSGLCERANYFGKVDSKGYFFETAQYETFLLCYQIGVVISRSSLFIFKYLTFVELLNIFQLLNFIFWFFEAKFGIISNQWICFFTLILLGICGGGVYVGCFYFILNDNKIPPQFKELCLNISTIFVDIGVLLSSLSCIILDNTIMQNKD